MGGDSVQTCDQENPKAAEWRGGKEGSGLSCHVAGTSVLLQWHTQVECDWSIT